MSEPEDYVSLKEFEGGSGWWAKVHSDGLRHMKTFERLPADKISEVAHSMGGKTEVKKFYENVAWGIQVSPLPYLQILMLLSLDPEFGNDFFTYYSKSALGNAPTEDIIVYSWIYISLLAREGNRVLGVAEPKHEKEEMAEAALEERLRVFRHIDPLTAEKVAKMIGGRATKVPGATWAIEKEPVPDFKITYILRDQNGEVLYDRKMVDNFHYFHDFLWLYCNAIIRESRKILGDKIPKLSASGIL